MNLPTPPGTSHRGKENRRMTFPEPGPSRVAWSDTHRIHNVSETPLYRASLPKSASKHAPAKSILKKTNWDELPPLEEERQITPEPADPLVDLDYLENPVIKIASAESTLRDLIEAYNVLAARLRACVTGYTDTDASWPLFQPLRKHREAIVQSMVRDLGRALEDPKSSIHLAPEHDIENIDPEILASCLPSPKPSPNPKRRKGMSAEEVKYARDLCTVCQSVLKLLSAVFTMPPVYQVFTDEQLSFLFTHVLAIPLANELPTPNARKTYALAIWLIQVQRLPVEVLAPAKDRIACALRRGIEGELGKEGKKGSASDGLKAIHDLCLGYPAVFVPAFANFLPSILDSLLAPTLMLRTQACHALGGFAYALASLPTSALHSRVACVAVEFLTKAPLGTPSTKPESPTKDPMIIRTLRTTLGSIDPKHIAQGPVWGLSVLANFVVMLGPILYLQEKVTKCMTALFSLVMRHPKSSVRGLGCLVWRTMTWAYFRPMPMKLSDADEEDEDGTNQRVAAWTDHEEEVYADRMVDTWHIVESIVDVGAGVATIGAALASTQEAFEDSDIVVRRVFGMLKTMARKGGLTTSDASEVLCRLVNRTQDGEWETGKLLPLPLFSGNPGLLTGDYKQLAQTIKPMFDECPLIEDVRCLTRDELTLEWVFGAVMELWKDMLVPLKLAWGSDFPPEVLGTWSGILRANVAALQDSYDSDGVVMLADYVADILNAILKSRKLDLSLKVDNTRELSAPTSPVRPDGEPFRGSVTPTGLPVLSPHRWRPALKLLLVRELWQAVQEIFPSSALGGAARKILAVLLEKEADLVIETRIADEVRIQWALLCSEVAYYCEERDLNGFWDAKKSMRQRPESVRSCIWSNFVMKWRDEKDAPWESSVILLGVPFIDTNSWDMTNDDLDEWDAFLRLTVDRALDYGIDSVAVIDRVAATISAQHCPTSLSSTRVADLLLSHLDFGEVRSAPSDLFEFVNDTLVSTYPPEPRNKVPSIWLLRTLTRTMDTCPNELQEALLETVQGGVCLWISDDYRALSHKEYELDVLPMYETIVANMMSFAPTVQTLEKFGSVIESAFCGRADKPTSLPVAFLEYWKCYSDAAEPSAGWPEQIVACLQAVGLHMEVDTEDLQDTEEVEAQIMVVPSSDRCVSPEIPSPRTIELSKPFMLHSYRSPVSGPSSPELLLAELPSTPRSSPHLAAPHRPHKSSSPGRLTYSLLSPSTSPPTTPVRPPVTPKRRNLGLGRSQTSPRKADKENASPLRSIQSVADRITMRSPPVSTTAVLGKRSLDVYDDGDVEGREGKRSRKDLSYIFGGAITQNPLPLEHRERAVVANITFTPDVVQAGGPPKSTNRLPIPALLASTSRTSVKPAIVEPSTPTPRPRPQKRKGLVFDAVEVPTLRSVRRKMSMEQVTFSENTSSLRPTQSLPPSPSRTTNRNLRKIRSQPRLSGDEQSENSKYAMQRRTVSLTHETRYESGSASETDGPESEDEGSPRVMSLSVRYLREMPNMNSDDSFTAATPSLTRCSTASSYSLSDHASSDDDPDRYVGQVTPHRLVSPSIRRVKSSDDAFEFGKAPGSDDSNMSASPTRDHVARMSTLKQRSAPQVRDALPLKSPTSAFELARSLSY